MATAPVLDPIESRSIGQDAETLRFERLGRVRARQRARRRHRLIVVTILLIALAGVGVLGFTANRRTSSERLGSLRTPAPVGMLKPAPAAIAPPPIRVDGVKRNATQPPRIQADADRRARPPSDSQGGDAVAPSRGEQQNADAVDPTAAIDWLLQTSRTRSP
jgi:hypothetical protein